MSPKRFVQISDAQGPLSGHIFEGPQPYTDKQVTALLNLQEGQTWADVASEAEIITRPVEAPADGQI